MSSPAVHVLFFFTLKKKKQDTVFQKIFQDYLQMASYHKQTALDKTKYTLHTVQSVSTALHLMFPNTIEYKLLLHLFSLSTSVTNIVVGVHELKTAHYMSGLSTLSIASTSLLRSNFELKKNVQLRKQMRSISPVHENSFLQKLLTSIRNTQRSQNMLHNIKKKIYQWKHSLRN
jgi:hypothetical protein